MPVPSAEPSESGERIVNPTMHYPGSILTPIWSPLSLTVSQAQLLEHSRAHPGSQEMARAAVVVRSNRLVAAGSVVASKPVEMASLTQVGTLSRAITDVEQAFPTYAVTEGGRKLAALQLLGFEEGGMVDPGAITRNLAAVRLPVCSDGDRQYIFAKSARGGNWLLPEADGGRRLVLIAVEMPSPHLQALDGTKKMIENVHETVRPALDITLSITRPVGERLGVALTPALMRSKEVLTPALETAGERLAQARDATKEASARTLETAGEHIAQARAKSQQTVAPAWQATKDRVAPVVEGTREVVVNGVNGTIRTVDGTRQAVGQGLEATGAAVDKSGLGKVWEGTRTTAGKAFAPAWKRMAPAVEPAWEATRSAVADSVETTGNAVEPAMESTKRFFSAVGRTVTEAIS